MLVGSCTPTPPHHVTFLPRLSSSGHLLLPPLWSNLSCLPRSAKKLATSAKFLLPCKVPFASSMDWDVDMEQSHCSGITVTKDTRSISDRAGTHTPVFLMTKTHHLSLKKKLFFLIALEIKTFLFYNVKHCRCSQHLLWQPLPHASSAFPYLQMCICSTVDQCERS